MAQAYDEAMDALSSLITKKTRTTKSSGGYRFELLFDYVKILDLEESISQMKIIHVAGTKGKGSTCTFTESILRNCGFHTGLFTSPHLIDIRERFRLDGVDICEEKFLAYFWQCWDRLKVDVAIMEVGLGGKFDATNVVQTPVVCGITSLGYDHTEILGNTLGAIAGEKSGIFKKGIPAFTVHQPDEAMQVLKENASKLDVPLQEANKLDAKLLNGLQLGLVGDHQYLNAGLAIVLCSTWLQMTGQVEVVQVDQTGSLPEQFIKGLTTATLQGRAQIMCDESLDTESSGDLVFYLDGAHSPESMEVCANWFSLAIKEDDRQPSCSSNKGHDESGASNVSVYTNTDQNSRKDYTQILLFNCMSVRDPWLLLPRLRNTCAGHGIKFKKALFVPNMSLYHKVASSSSLPPSDSQVDLSWQLTLQKEWENIMCGEIENGRHVDFISGGGIEHGEMNVCGNSMVFPSLPLAIKWLRDSVKENKSLRLQVLVTGSLHLVGDVMKFVKN